ncbi:hypothetical protein [Bacillus sp. SM2101]|uniref:hypothetical protein n=1 Tax=Bacillus sp. SM2101 TaxID=2805366 RepID=UPI001BDDE877|nr:hypothetical protein [Bacillus sp. SM2101]
MIEIKNTMSFVAGDDQILLKEGYVIRNGEVIAEGKVFPFTIMLGQPAWIIVIENDYTPPVYVKTINVVSYIPKEQEYFEGQSYPPKYIYSVDYLTKSSKRNMRVYAVDQIHAKSLCMLARDEDIKILSMTKEENNMTTDKQDFQKQQSVTSI